MQEPPRVVDLFCGCGGFSLGAHAAGLAPSIAIDIDPILTSSLQANFPETRRVLADLSDIHGSDIEREMSGKVDGMFGGPPCQAFSEIGRRTADDPRRSLLGHFFRLVAELRPAFFVMENVKGLGYPAMRSVLESALNLVPANYVTLGPITLDAADFGSATKRPRLFVIGYDPSRMNKLTLVDIETTKSKPVTVRAAIADLATAIKIEDTDGFDLWKIKRSGIPSKYAAALRTEDGTFTGHRRTLHTSHVSNRFKRIEPGKVDTVGRHHRLDWDGQCPTLRAGTGSERGSYQSVRPIHPDEPRVITVREAARLQGFPDIFRFHPTIWHSFRMIGNSVSPILSKIIFSLIADRIGSEVEIQDAAE